jgi:hypothetical protein
MRLRRGIGMDRTMDIEEGVVGVVVEGEMGIGEGGETREGGGGVVRPGVRLRRARGRWRRDTSSRVCGISGRRNLRGLGRWRPR